jgi:hypothetical protein
MFFSLLKSERPSFQIVKPRADIVERSSAQLLVYYGYKTRARPCWKTQTTRGLRYSLRADLAKRGRFSTQRALSAPEGRAWSARSLQRSLRADHAQTTRKVGTWSAR